MDGIVLDCSLEDMEEKGIIQLSDEEKEKIDEEYALRERKLSNVYIPPEELEKLEKSYTHSVVQDFDDMYHLTKEEREKMMERYGKFIALKKRRKKIRKIDQYVETHRLCMDILDDIAETNGIYSPEKFKKLVLSDKIIVDGLVFPKLQGKLRKTINWDYVAEEYIEDRTKDPKELLREDDAEEFNDDESFENAVERFFGDKEKFNEILKEETEEERIKNSRPILNPEGHDNVAIVGDKKSRKQLIKVSPGILNEIKKREKLDRRHNRAKSYISNLDETDMEFIEKYDTKRSKKKDGYIPEFKGDATNKADVDFYIAQMEEYERENTYVEYNGRSMTINDYNELQLKDAMDKNGWNLRNCYVNKKEEKKLRKARKKDKKKEKELKRMLIEIQERKKGRKEAVEGIKINSKKRKDGIGKKKKVKKKNKKEMNYFDDVLLDINGSTKETFKEYRKEMEDFTWKK